MYRDGMNKVLSKINEGIVNSIESEPTIGVDEPKDFRQCTECNAIYVGESEECPICGAKKEAKNESKKVIKRARKFEACEDEDCDGKCESEDEEIEDETTVIEEEDDEDLPKDVEIEVTEGMKMLSTGNCKKFNESFKDARMLKNGSINFLVESKTGRVYSVVRKTNAIQRANFKLSESMVKKTSKRAVTSAKLESVRSARMSLAVISEMSRVKVAAARLLERQGVKFNFAKFNEAMNDVVADATEDLEKKFEEIAADKETGAVEFEDVTPEEIAQDVTEVVKDTGLEVVTQEVDATGDTAAVQIRVQDDPDREINLQDVADAASDVLDAPVAVIGPTQPEGDSTLADFTVLVNPDEAEVEVEDDDEEKEEIKLSERKSFRKASKKFESEEDDEAQKEIDAEYDEIDAEEDELKSAEDLDEEDEVDAEDDVTLLPEEDEEDETKVVIEEEDDDDEETKALIDKAKKIEERIRRRRQAK